MPQKRGANLRATFSGTALLALQRIRERLNPADRECLLAAVRKIEQSPPPARLTAIRILEKWNPPAKDLAPCLKNRIIRTRTSRTARAFPGRSCSSSQEHSCG